MNGGEVETYQALRGFADSWWLLVMFGFFVGVVLFTFRPGSKRTHDDIANIPLRDDDLTRLREADADENESGPGTGRADEGGGPGTGRGDGSDGRAERLVAKEA